MNNSVELNLKQLFPFQLDQFQTEAIAALAEGKSVVVCAPTGSGKTIIGEYAIYRAVARNRRVFYTTPLKALSNQKFRDFEANGALDDVGLITGDIIINPQASVVVMTTEIFRNMLYETPIGQVGTSLEDVDAVILDECHYLSDRGRGTVWEESIIYCPPSIQLVALSATIGNPEEFTDWINGVRSASVSNVASSAVYCELINSDYRPVPLRFYFSSAKGLTPLLNSQQTELNRQLKSKKPAKRRRVKNSDCPTIPTVVEQLQAQAMLPAIYIIFSRRGCDGAVEKLDDTVLVTDDEAQKIWSQLIASLLLNQLELQEIILEFLAGKNSQLHDIFQNLIANNPQAESQLYQHLKKHPQTQSFLCHILAQVSGIAKPKQFAALIRGIASHHAGLLPPWKELVEQLFEQGLVKLVFATATLAAGINMPARTTVISALSKRTDNGHSMLTPSEFLQIAGRAGRRGMDTVGHVVTVQTPFEGAQEAAYLATAEAEPLRSWFAPSYGMVLNLLQKHSLEEVQELLQRSFAEYLAQLKLAPQQQQIAEISTELAKLDVELAAINPEQIASYEKLKERLKEEHRLLDILQKQAEANRKREIAPLIGEIEPGRIVGLKGKHVKTASPLAAVVIEKMPASGQGFNWICLAVDNRWYIVNNSDIADLNDGDMPAAILEAATLPSLENFKLGKWRKGDGNTAIASNQILDYAVAVEPYPEVKEQQQRVDWVQQQLDQHPLQQYEHPTHLLKRSQKRLKLQEQLRKSQLRYQQSKHNKSYYWEDFLNLILVLQEFEALDGYQPTWLGEVAATIRADNELWLALALTSGELDNLTPSHLAAAMAALISETPRTDYWCNFTPSTEVLEALGIKKRSGDLKTSVLREIRPHLFQTQRRYDVSLPVWREFELVGIVEQWAMDIEWGELCENTNMDEGDIVRMLRRTIDILWQIPQIPGISSILADNARVAVTKMKRFPI